MSLCFAAKATPQATRLEEPIEMSMAKTSHRFQLTVLYLTPQDPSAPSVLPRSTLK